MITGGAGNKPITDPGWPTGAAAIFNHPGRVAWWEGPPFGGGQWHAECRGDAKALNAVLADFARMDVKTKRVVVHDGTGHSFWLAPNREPEKLAAAKIDWVFMVWQPASWEHLRKLPADLNPTEPGDTAPALADRRLHRRHRLGRRDRPGGDRGRRPAPGGPRVHGRRRRRDRGQGHRPVDQAADRRDDAAQRVEPQEKGGYLYPVVAEAKADAQGHWVLRKAPAGWVRVVVEADGFVPRVAGYARFDEQPRWQSYDCGLARSAPVSGRVTDEDGKPLADVDVRLDNVQPASGGRYESPLEYTFKTDAEGRFRAEQVPVGKATIWVHKPGYCRPGLGHADHDAEGRRRAEDDEVRQRPRHGGFHRQGAARRIHGEDRARGRRGRRDRTAAPGTSTPRTR